MSGVLKISEAASLALHSMAYLVTKRERPVPTRDIAARFHISEAHLSKVLQRLARAGLVKSTRGPRGGFVIGESDNDITLLDVYEAIEGPLISCNCLLDKPVCGGTECILGGILATVDNQIREYLAGTKLSELANCIKEER